MFLHGHCARGHDILRMRQESPAQSGLSRSSAAAPASRGKCHRGASVLTGQKHPGCPRRPAFPGHAAVKWKDQIRTDVRHLTRSRLLYFTVVLGP